MEMSAKLLPIGFSSPAHSPLLYIGLKAECNLSLVHNVLWNLLKDWFQKSLSEYVTVSIALSLFDEFYPAERKDVCMARERNCTSVEDAE